MRKANPIESRVAMSLQRLELGNTLRTIGEVNGMVEGIVS